MRKGKEGREREIERERGIKREREGGREDKEGREREMEREGGIKRERERLRHCGSVIPTLTVYITRAISR